MFDLLSQLDGWEYEFPYLETNVPIEGRGFHTIYDTSQSYPNGAIVYATLFMDTDDFKIKLSTGSTVLHEIDVKGLLYGQSVSGYNVPSGLISNVYLPLKEESLNYPISVSDPSYNPATGVAFYTENGLPYKRGIKLEVKVRNPPATIYENSIGLVNIFDEKKYIDSLKRVLGEKNDHL